MTGWGRPHTHEWQVVRTIGTLTIERCECGKVRHVVEQITGPRTKAIDEES